MRCKFITLKNLTSNIYKISSRCCCRTPKPYLLLLLLLLLGLALIPKFAMPLLFFPSYFPISPFGFYPTWIYDENLKWDGEWKDLSLSSPFTPTWSCDQVKRQVYDHMGRSFGQMALRQSFHSSDSSPHKWLPLFCCQINVLIYYWSSFFEIIDYHYYYWLID